MLRLLRALSDFRCFMATLFMKRGENRTVFHGLLSAGGDFEGEGDSALSLSGRRMPCSLLFCNVKEVIASAQMLHFVCQSADFVKKT